MRHLEEWFETYKTMALHGNLTKEKASFECISFRE